MRIVGGRLRGRALVTPADQRIRPTSDRVREAVFNILAHGIDDFALQGALVLDLFAGTGALGLEALSRGAASCLFVEEDAEARGLIRDNIEAFGLTGVTRIYRRDATDLGDAGNREPFTLAFLDPPYGKGLGALAIASAMAGKWLAPGAVVVLEERADTTITWPPGCAPFDRRAWGDTEVHFARAMPQIP
ncbi:MAG: 16S rRNA (guanine(966)-N(2))-methyltransferase RsmD [Hyphomicrobiaceae bacterium]